MDTIQDKIHYYVPQLAPKAPPTKLGQVVDQIQAQQQQQDQQRDDEILSEEEKQLQQAIAISQVEK